MSIAFTFLLQHANPGGVGPGKSEQLLVFLLFIILSMWLPSSRATS